MRLPLLQEHALLGMVGGMSGLQLGRLCSTASARGSSLFPTSVTPPHLCNAQRALAL